MSGTQGPAPSAPQSAPNQRATNAPLARIPPVRRSAQLRKSDLQDKLLITRTTGRQFGALSEAWVEPRRLRVALFDVVQPGLVPSLTGLTSKEARGAVAVKRLREVGDVVLIQNDQDFCPEARTNRQGLTLLSGLNVKSETGELLGKVRDFVFEPGSGRIVRLIFDGLGLSYLPVGFLDEFAVDVREISRIVIPEGVIYVRAPARYVQIASGKFNFLKNVAGFLEFLGEDEEEQRRRGEGDTMEGSFEMMEEKYKRVLEETKKQQEAYYAMYGSQVPGMRPRQAAPTSQPQPGSGPPPEQYTSGPSPPGVTMSGDNSRQQSGPRQQGKGDNASQPPIDEWLVREKSKNEAYDFDVMQDQDPRMF